MNYTEEQIKEWKSKAEKWDALDAEIAEFYPEFKDDNEDDEDFSEEEGGDLIDIGEAAARAFGYM